MKHTITTFLALLCLLTCGIGASAQGFTPLLTDEEEVQWDTVYTASEFYNVINKNNAANVKLGADIDLSGHSANDDCIFNFTFKGKIDGKIIQNTAVTEDSIRTDTIYHKLMNSSNDLLFNDLSGAEISNLFIYNCSFDGWDSHSGWLGTQAYNCTFKNILVSNCSASADNTFYDNDNMGGLIGISHNCTYNTVYSVASSLKTDGTYAGLIVGKDEGSTFTNCFTGPTSSIWACGSVDEGDTGAAFCGGICGYASGSTFTRCYNEALVSSEDDRIGGIIGYGENTTLSQCQNLGLVLNTDEDGYNTMKTAISEKAAAYATNASTFSEGQLAGITISYGSLTGLLVYGVANYVAPAATHTITVTVVEEETTGLGLQSGEIVGEITTETAENTAWSEVTAGETAASANGTSAAAGSSAGTSCLVTTGAAVLAAVFTAVVAYNIYVDIYQADEMGGIAGSLFNSTVNRCVNYGIIQAQDEECGGIVGYCDASTVTNCLNRGLVYADTKAGGIAGYCCNNSTLKGNVNISGVSANKWGQIYDVNDADGVTSENNYYVYSNSTTNSNGCISATPEDFATGSIALALNTVMNDTIWRQDLGNSMYPIPVSGAEVVTATTDNPCLADTIRTAVGFFTGVSNPYARLNLQADIDLSGMSCVNMSSEDCPFTGVINGNGHTISNVTYEVPYPEGSSWTDVNAALFPFAKNATFRNFTINNFTFTQADFPDMSVAEHPARPNCEALLVAQSTGCTYDSIKITSSAIYHSDEWVRWVGGLVSLSTNDTFTDCSVDENCTFQSQTGTSCNDALLGGIAGKGTNSSFIRCYNAGTIDADDEKVGGIVGTTEGSSNIITHCLNTGAISGHEYTGGIVGCAYNTDITYCVNTGNLADDNNKRQEWRGGIAGCISGGSKAYCLNFGSVNYASDNCGAIGQLTGGATDGGHSYYYCQYNGTHEDNEGEYTADADTIYRYAKMLSGEFAYKAKDADGNAWLYQNIDGRSFTTNVPNPIADAGVVYSNVLCDGALKYSNDYNSTGSHTGTADQFGYCTICGTSIGDPASEIHITKASEIVKLSDVIIAGKSVKNSTVYLDNDINMSGSYFAPIGDYPDYPYAGTFDGQGYRITNLTYTNSSTSEADGTGVGFFGCVSDTAVIRNLVIDKTCTITGSHNGTAGIVGCLALPSDESTDSINFTMENCGNEATVSGNINAAGLIGGVYNTDASGKSKITVSNCYNAGSITGSEQSAAFIGYATHDVTVSNCLNTGTVTGYDASHSLIRYKDDALVSGTKIYNLSTLATDDYATPVTSDSIRVGILCKILNANRGENSQWSQWAQDIASDTIPSFGTTGVTYTRSTTNRWGTIVLPFDVTPIYKDPYSLYEYAALKDSVMVLKKLSGTLRAGTPAFFRMDNASLDTATNAYKLVITADTVFNTTITNPQAVGTLTLTGLSTTTSLTGKKGYVFYNGSFWNFDLLTSTEVSRSAYNTYLSGGLPTALSIIRLTTDEYDDMSSVINISDTTHLANLATLVDGGTDYTGVTINLVKDIDGNGAVLAPIGSADTTPFKGTFNGNYHHLKNLTISGTTPGTGLFGNVADSTVIENIVLDSTCTVTVPENVASCGGIVGRVVDASNVIIRNCGNEAKINGWSNVGAILGSVASAEAKTVVENCYNTGTISGSTLLGAISGGMGSNFTLTNCYNLGPVTSTSDGADYSGTFYLADAAGTVSNCYNKNAAQGEGVAKLDSIESVMGLLCDRLNANCEDEMIWAQNIATEPYPTFGGDGVKYTRKMKDEWSTIIVPFNINIDPREPYKFYDVLSVSDTTLYVVEVTGVLSAGTPAILHMSEAAKTDSLYQYTWCAFDDVVLPTVTPTTNDNLTLIGTYTPVNVTDTIGYVQNDSIFQLIPDIKEQGTIICPAYHAYLYGTPDDMAGGAKKISRLHIAVKEEATGISDTTPVTYTVKTSAIYDLSGRRHGNLQKGVNIIRLTDGTTKKVMVQ